MSRQEVAYRCGQSDTDLRDARCPGLSANLRLCCAYEGARHAAIACLGELNVDHRDDLELFVTFAATLNLTEAAGAPSVTMVRLYRAQMRAIYDGVIPADTSTVEEVLRWAHAVSKRPRMAHDNHAARQTTPRATTHQNSSSTRQKVGARSSE
jgi:hypothetical protein